MSIIASGNVSLLHFWFINNEKKTSFIKKRNTNEYIEYIKKVYFVTFFKKLQLIYIYIIRE